MGPREHSIRPGSAPHPARTDLQAVLRELQHAIKVTVNVVAAACADTTCRDHRGPTNDKRLASAAAKQTRKLLYAPELDDRSNPG